MAKTIARPLTPQVFAAIKSSVKRGEVVTPNGVSKTFGLNTKIAAWAIKMACGQQ